METKREMPDMAFPAFDSGNPDRSIYGLGVEKCLSKLENRVFQSKFTSPVNI
jgi:hypothetical protein